MTRRLPLPALLLALLAAACRSPGPPGALEADRRAVEGVLDDWHAAASRAAGPRYFGHMAEDAVFLGTDASERWDLAAFRAYCEPHFARGVGWTYTSRERHVRLDGALAWFDERLWNEKYGECRGTGVLRQDAGEWRIVHYSLSLPIPNELAPEVVAKIRAR